MRVGHRVTIGQGIVGRVAASREPMLVVDVQEAATHPLLKDEYLTTGSFISFPLVRHDSLIGVVNLTNRAQRGLFVEEDVERVRLLGLVIALVATEADVDAKVAELAAKRGEDAGKMYASLQKAGRLRELERGITEDRVFAWLLERNTIEQA